MGRATSMRKSVCILEENVFWKRSSDVIIIEDMILKMSVKNLGKMNGRFNLE